MTAHDRPITPWGFAGVAVASFGGPLALAALIAPATIAGAASSAGFEMVAAVVVFLVPLVVWLRYAAEISSSGGLFAYVESAAGRTVALVQAAIWIFSYLLYLVYTTVQVVYDLLPSVFAGEGRYQTLLALLIPVAIAGVMVAGRTPALLAIGAIAVIQVVLACILDGVTLAHLPLPASSFGTSAPSGGVSKAAAQTSLLYVCGSLPLFLGGELATPVRTIRRGLIGAYALTAVLVTLAVAPIASSPGLASTDLPGVSVLEQFSTRGVADDVGIGVALSTVAVILCEYLALTRLLHAIRPWPIRRITLAVGVVVVIAAPISLIDPDGFYNTLSTPSLVALWASQLIVFAVFPLFARRRQWRIGPALLLGAGACALSIYGLVTAFGAGSS